MLRISELSKSLGADPVLEEVQLEIAADQLVLLQGPSGAGKTTLLHLIAGIHTPDTGRIFWGAQEFVGPAAWVPPWERPVSLVFQDLALWPHLTVAEHLDFVLKGRRAISRSQRLAIRDSWLERLQIAQFAARYPAALSGGQQQRVAIARSMVREAELLLLDEPLSQLDAALAQQVWCEITDWRKSAGATILTVTHDAPGLSPTADQFYLLHGRHVEPVLSGAGDGIAKDGTSTDSHSPPIRLRR